MKNIYILLMLLLSQSLMAQNQYDGFSYQAVVRNSEGIPVVNEEIDISIALLGRESTRPYYSEEHLIRTDAYGQINIIVGQGINTNGDLQAVPWENEPIFYKIHLVNEDQNLDIISEAQLLAVPYAFHANTANQIKNDLDDDSGIGRNETGKYWSLTGNIVPGGMNKLGTLNEEDLNIVTQDNTRIYINQDGDIDVFGETTIHHSLNVSENFKVDGLTSLEGTRIQGPTDIRNNLKVGGSLEVLSPVQFSSDFNVGGNSLFEGDLTVRGNSNLQSISVEDGVINNTLTVGGATNLNSSLDVQGLSTLNQLKVLGNSELDGTLEVGQNALFNSNVDVNENVDIEKDLTVDGTANFNGQAVFDHTIGGLQTDLSSYPVLIKGSKQGLAIEVVAANNSPTSSGRGNNYISFWKDGVQTGRIEGMSKADLDPTGLVALITQLIQTPPDAFDLDIDFDNIFSAPPALDELIIIDGGEFPMLTGGSVGTLPSLSGGSFGSIDPPVAPHFPTLNKGTLPVLPTLTIGRLPDINFADIETWVGFIDFDAAGAELSNSQFINDIADFGNAVGNTGPDTPASLIWSFIDNGLRALYPVEADPEGLTNFQSQILSNYTLDVLTQGISTVNELYGFISSISSILDPGDVLTEATDLIVELTNLIIYGSYADINLGVAYESGSGDYAEWLMRANPEEFISPGDVVGVIGGKISKSFTHADKFMVVSTAPLLLGNMPETEKEKAFSEKIAFMGQVPVKVLGEVEIGDYILPSGCGDGLAIAVAPEDMLAKDYQRIVGVAWEKSTGEFVSLINTAIGINQNDMSKVVEQMQATLNHIQASLKQLDPEYVVHQYDVDHQNFVDVSDDISVSPNHRKFHNQYFDGRSYDNKKAMLADVKRVLNENSQIDLSQFPLVDYVFSNPEKADQLAKTYGTILEEMKEVKTELSKGME